MRKSLTLKEFTESQTVMSTYDEEGLLTSTDLSDILNSMGVDSDVEVTVEVRDDGSYRYSYSWATIKHASLALYITYDDRSKRYLVYEDSTKLLKNIDSYTIRDVKNIIAEPNKIGVLTPKKIGDWVKYYEDVYYQLKVIDDCKAVVKKEFLDSLKGLNVTWSSDGKAGSIIRNGVEYSFVIRETYISERVELHYSVPNSLQSFLALSDNNYKSLAK